jgi:hypothetical protein
MEFIKDPRLYPKNIHYYKALSKIISEYGNCLNVRCRSCPFASEWPVIGCLIGEYLKPYGNAHSDNKIYYSAMLLSLYTEAEVLTMLIQGELNGTNA